MAMLALAFVIAGATLQQRLLQVHQVPFLSESECEWVVRAVEAHAVEAHAERPESSWQSLLNFNTREVRFLEVEALRHWWDREMKNTAFELLRKQFWLSASDSLDLVNSNIVRYTPDESGGVRLHTDGDRLTFNVLLSASDSFEGGGTYIAHTNETLFPAMGHALMYFGEGVPVSKGRRYIWQGFVNVTGDHWSQHSAQRRALFGKFSGLALKMQPRDSLLYYNLGNWWDAAENSQSAMLNYARVFPLHSAHPETYWNLGFDLGYTSAAIQAYNQGIHVHTRHAGAYSGVGPLLKPSHAMQSYQKALHVDAAHGDTYFEQLQIINTPQCARRSELVV